MRVAAFAGWSFVATLGSSSPALGSTIWSGSVGEQARVFFAPPMYPGQRMELVQPALILEGLLALEGSEGVPECEINPYLRYDSIDEGRTLFDLQSAKCRAEGDEWALTIGYDVEPWGVLQFVNPADVWNQRDLNDDIVGTRKLGRPMGHVAFATESGTFEFYVSTWFTPLSFPGWAGRLRPPLAVDEEEVRFASSLGRAHPAAALRYSHAWQEVQLSASYYYGYQRDPIFAVAADPSGPYLFAAYSLQHLGSLELQAALGSLILKSEVALRFEEDGAYDTAAAGLGLEFDIGASLTEGQSINAFLEYAYDSRPSSLIVPFNNDLLGGVRVGLNDVRATELILWSDVALSERSVQIVAFDASTLIFDNLKLSVGVRILPWGAGAFEPIAGDDHVNIRLRSYF